MSELERTQTETADLTVREGLNQALFEEMDRDESVFVFGEDIADYGGLYKITDGLLEEFGNERVFDTPLAETSIGGGAVGAALAGARPDAEIMFSDFLAIISDHLINYAAKMHFNYGDGASVRMVVRSIYGAGDGHGLHHGQSPEGWFTNVPGLKIVMPSTPRDYKGLLKSAIRDDDPVLFLENKMSYDDRGPVPEEEYTLPLGEAAVEREGDDVTVVATQAMLYEAFEAADQLAGEIEVEIVSPRTLDPLDIDTIAASIDKTGRAVVVDEPTLTAGAQSEIVAQINESSFWRLDAPIKRLGVPNVPIPFSPPLEQEVIPDSDDVVEAVISLF
jgi:pyruvate dehydrogenase E1 component beta subunit